MTDKQYVRGLGRGLQLVKRVDAAGEHEFRSGFSRGRLPDPRACALCSSGASRIKLQRQHVHYVDRRVLICQGG